MTKGTVTLQEHALQAAYAMFSCLDDEPTYVDVLEATRAAKHLVDSIRTSNGRRLARPEHIVASAFWSWMMRISDVHPRCIGGGVCLAFHSGMREDLGDMQP